MNRMNYPTSWSNALNLTESMKREVRTDGYDVREVIVHNFHNIYYTFGFDMCRFTRKGIFVPYITEKYGLDFIGSEYNHITTFDAYEFKLDNIVES